MRLPSILVATIEDLADEALTAHNLPKPDLLIILCSDMREAQSHIPQALRGIPVLALPSPDISDEALATLHAARIHCHKLQFAQLSGGLVNGDCMVGDSEAVQEIKASIRRIAATDCNVLITGETGTGKELIGELIQGNSSRRANRYVCINCAAVPDSLLESELFGYERGAFTGAQAACAGKLESAQGGTVLFDEIGEMSLTAQAKILRLIETKEIQRLGSRKTSRIDFRVIAATNLDVDSPESSARFRRDLYFRLNVARIHVPPLRDRRSDIPLLIGHFIQHFNDRFGRRVDGIAEDAGRALLSHGWPGNIRELKNTVEALFVNLDLHETRLTLPERLRRYFSGSAGLPLSEQERLLSALWATDWNKSKAARQLRWSRMTLYRKMVKYKLEHKTQPRPAMGESTLRGQALGTANGQ